MQGLTLGVDTLVLSYKVSKYSDEIDIEALKLYKNQAGEKLFENTGKYMKLNGIDFLIQPRGLRGYDFVLNNGDFNVRIASKALSGRILPEVVITLRSSFLWREGYIECLNIINNWLEGWATITETLVSRLDICCDMISKTGMPEIDLRNEAITRSKTKTSHKEYEGSVKQHNRGERITGYTLGKGDLMCRIYDKTIEVKQSQKEWYYDLWAEKGWNGSDTIVRVEYQARRDFLKKFNVGSIEDIKSSITELWSYFTESWLRVCEPGNRSQRHFEKWKVKPWWKEVQKMGLQFGRPHGRMPVNIKRPKYTHLMRQALGCLNTAVACISSDYDMLMARNKVRHDIREEMELKEFWSKAKKRMVAMRSVNPIGRMAIIQEARAMLLKVTGLEYGMTTTETIHKKYLLENGVSGF